MNRNVTPRPIQVTGARDAHGRILDPASGALYVHMHRESGLAHRHYVLKPWQVRLLALAVSRPMLLLYLLALVTWGWMASQAARVPVLQQRITELRRETDKLDTLTARLSDMQVRYEQVQKMLGAAAAAGGAPAAASSGGTKAPPATRADSARKDAAGKAPATKDTATKDTARTPAVRTPAPSGAR